MVGTFLVSLLENYVLEKYVIFFQQNVADAGRRWARCSLCHLAIPNLQAPHAHSGTGALHRPQGVRLAGGLLQQNKR